MDCCINEPKKLIYAAHACFLEVVAIKWQLPQIRHAARSGNAPSAEKTRGIRRGGRAAHRGDRAARRGTFVQPTHE